MLFAAWTALFLLGLAATVVIIHLLVSVTNTFNSALPVATPRAVVQDVILALALPERGRFAEPGCGDGRILAAAVDRMPHLKVEGVDNNPVTLSIARWHLHGRGKLVHGNLMKSNFTKADRVFTYLSPKMMTALEPRFESELPKGARLVSLQFPLPGRAADEEVSLSQNLPHAKRLYIYNY